MITGNRFATVLLLTLTVAACGGHTSVGPVATAPSPVTNSAPSVRGQVYDTAGRHIAGATVQVVDGPEAGKSATSDATGEFALTGQFDDTTLFRATKEGHVAATQHWLRNSFGQPWLGFSLHVLAPPVNIAGNYTLTFIADSACAANLPNEVRTRTYEATITPWSPESSTYFKVAVSGPTVDSFYNWFEVGVAGDYLGFWLADGEYLVEHIAADTYLELSGAAAGSVGTSGVSMIFASFDGVFDYRVQGFTHARCESKNHQLILTRR